MPIFAFGINYKTAPIAFREQTVITSQAASAALQDLMQNDAVNEAMILSTCNRTELYVEINEMRDTPSLLQNWFALQKNLQKDSLTPHFYCHREEAAVQHIMRVACGLDSMVLGEPQIFGQMKEAFALAKRARTIGPKLGRLLQAVFAVTKQVRTDTTIGQNPVSLAYTALHLAKRFFKHTANCNVLCIGLGDITKLVALYLHKHGFQQITLVRRTTDKTMHFAKRIGAHCITFRDIPAYLKDTDILISATASQIPILNKETVETALEERKHRPLLLLDMAMPRDIEAEISELENVYLYNLDDLQNVVKQGYQCRQQAVTEAEFIINQRAASFMCELMGLDAVTAIRTYRHHAEKIREAELNKARTALAQGASPDNILENLSRQLVSKLLHKPTIQLRQFAYNGQTELLNLLKDLYCHD